MPEVPAVIQAEQPLIQAYQNAWQRVVAEQEALIHDPLRVTRSRRLTEMRSTIERTMAEIEPATRAWIAQRLPEVYTVGGAVGAAPLGGEFLWTAISQEAVEQLATGLFDELLQATRFVRRTTKTLIRQIGRSEALQVAIQGRTAVAAGREMRRLIEEHGIHAVRYANGARHGLAEYSEMAIRTTTAKAYNYGILNGAAQHGCEFWEVFDGPNCGWTAHDSGEMALGKIVTRDEAFEWPISHPNCRRTFGPRPDLSATAPAEAGRGSVTAEQVAAQRVQDQQRAAVQARRALRDRQRAVAQQRRTPQARIEKRAARLRGRRPPA